MKNYTIIIIIKFTLLVLCASLIGCSIGNDKPKWMDISGHAGMVDQNEVLFRDAAVKFVKSASQGRLDQMMASTSSITIANSGAEKTKSIYKNEVIPAFLDTNPKLNPHGKIIRDEFDNNGLAFRGSMKDGKSKYFIINIFGENGKLVVARIYRE